MCVALSGYVERAGSGLRIIQYPNIHGHEKIWAQRVDDGVKNGEQWAITEKLKQARPADVIGPSEDVVSWEYELHLGIPGEDFGNNDYLRLERLGTAFELFIALNPNNEECCWRNAPDWWDEVIGKELVDYIRAITSSPEVLFDYITKNSVALTSEHWRCLLAEKEGVAGDEEHPKLSQAGWCVVWIGNGFNSPQHYKAWPTADWHELWPNPANRVDVWRTEEEKKALSGVDG